MVVLNLSDATGCCTFVSLSEDKVFDDIAVALTDERLQE